MNQSHMKALSFIWNIYTAAQYTALSIRQPVKSQCKFIISIKHQNGPPARSLAFSCSSLKRPGNNTTLELFLQVIKIAIPLPLTSLNLNASQRRYSAVFTYYLTLYFFTSLIFLNWQHNCSPKMKAAPPTSLLSHSISPEGSSIIISGRGFFLQRAHSLCMLFIHSPAS